MAEVAELQPFDSEDEEIDDEADPWSLRRASPPAFVPELHSGRSLHVDKSGSGELTPSDADSFVPVFSPGIHHFCSGHLSHHILPEPESDSDSSFAEDQATLALDLFERSSPQHASGCGGGSGGGDGDEMGQGDPFSISVIPYGFGVFNGAEDMGSDYLELGPGLGLGFGLEKPKEDEEGGMGMNLEDEVSLDLGGDEFFVGVVSTSGGADGEPSRSQEGEGLRIVGFGTDSDSDEDEIACRMRSHTDAGDAPGRMLDDMGLPLCWGCLRIEEERRDPDECFDWEEVDGRTNEREVVSPVIIDDESSIAPDEEGAVHSVEWEVLLAMHNLDRNVPFEHEDAESYLGEGQSDYVYTSEYEVLFDQFADHENLIKGGHPAAELVIEHLPSVILTQLDVANNNTICAVCKDEISLEEKAKQLPCSHHYHACCILPWLRIRNTCPVCRHELPTDDPSYENWRAWRVRNGVTMQDSQVRYDFGVFPEE